MIKRKWGQSGAPWEAMKGEREQVPGSPPGRWVRVIFGAKMRSEIDLQRVLELYRKEFELRYPLIGSSGGVGLDKSSLVQVGEAWGLGSGAATTPGLSRGRSRSCWWGASGRSGPWSSLARAR